MDHRYPVRPSAADVRAALLWALEHDRAALLAHRETAHRHPRGLAREIADRRLVAHWVAVHGIVRDDGPPPPAPAARRSHWVPVPA